MAFVEPDSFTTQARVESFVGRGAHDVNSVPTAQQVLDFMALRAAEIQGTLFAAGVTSTVPSGGSPIVTTTDQGKTLARLCDQANAMLAAGDTIWAHDIRDDGEDPPADAVALWKAGAAVLETLEAFLVTIPGGATVRTATSTGGIEKADFTELGFEKEKPRSEMFHLGTKW